MSEKIGVIHSYYTKETPQAIIDTAEALSQEIVDFGDNLEKISPEGISMLVVLGGDGAIGQVGNLIIKENWELPIAITDKGTSNTLFNAVSAAGYTYESGLDTPPQFLSYRPGMVGDQVFMSDAGLGSTEPLIGTINEFLREKFDIGKHRPKLAALVSLVGVMLSGTESIPPLDLFTVSSHYGSSRVFPDQALNSDDVTRTWVEADTKTEALLKTFFGLLFLGGGLQSVAGKFVNQDKQEEFLVDRPIDTFRLGGDTVKADLDSGTTVKRSSKSLKVITIST